MYKWKDSAVRSWRTIHLTGYELREKRISKREKLNSIKGNKDKNESGCRENAFGLEKLNMPTQLGSDGSWVGH